MYRYLYVKQHTFHKYVCPMIFLIKYPQIWSNFYEDSHQYDILYQTHSLIYSLCSTSIWLMFSLGLTLIIFNNKLSPSSPQFSVLEWNKFKHTNFLNALVNWIGDEFLQFTLCCLINQKWFSTQSWCIYTKTQFGALSL